MIGDLFAVPFADAMLVSLPTGVDPLAAASVGDNVSDAYRHVAPHLSRLLDEDPDARVLIFASLTTRQAFTASMPLYTGMIALALGARNVELVDARANVRELATRLGMQALSPRELRDVEPAPLVVDVTAEPRGFVKSLEKTAPDGACSHGGGLHARARIPLLRTYIRNVAIHVGRTHARAVVPEVLALIADGRLRPQDVTTQVAAIDDAPAALREHCRGDAIKTILTAT
jgi:alcohol dehydrogenase